MSPKNCCASEIVPFDPFILCLESRSPVELLWSLDKDFYIPVAKVCDKLVMDADIRSLRDNECLTDRVSYVKNYEEQCVCSLKWLLHGNIKITDKLLNKWMKISYNLNCSDLYPLLQGARLLLVPFSHYA